MKNIVHLVIKIVKIINLHNKNPYNQIINNTDSEMNNIIEILDNDIFLLMNYTGVFSINTYLYSFFNSVNLFGIPIEDNFADGILLNVEVFIGHDVAHFKDIFKSKFNGNREVFNFYKYIYFKILNSEKINEDYKKRLILFIWLLIHEYYAVIIPKNIEIKDKNYKIFNDIFLINIIAILEDFSDYFSSLIFEENIIESLEKDSKFYYSKIVLNINKTMFLKQNKEEYSEGSEKYIRLFKLAKIYSMYITLMVNIFTNFDQILENGL